ncbi:Meckelin, partial [Ochromonadaceae sp. CCMP2298]
TYFGTAEDVLYCQQLANLCTLQLYDNTACIAHVNVYTERNNAPVSDVDTWVQGSPWLYVSGDPSTVVREYILRTRVNLVQDPMELFLAKYAMNGTFLGFENLQTQLAYCRARAPYSGSGGGTSTATDWLTFGANRRMKMRCELKSLAVEGDEQVFYEMWQANIQSNNYDSQSMPAYIRMTNTRVDGAFVMNQQTTLHLVDSTDVLVRRFFLVDRVSGLTAATVSSGLPQVLRYAKYISIEVSLRDEYFARIYPPVITIEYANTLPAEWGTSPETQTEFSMYYTQDEAPFFTNFQVFFIVIMVMCAMLFALRYRNWQQRNSRVVNSAALSTDLGGFNMSTLSEMALLAANTWVLVFLPVTIGVAWYYFCFFKLQTLPAVLLPPSYDINSPSSPYFLFTANIHVMFFLQLWYVSVLVYRQCKADLFFIDWEPASAKAKADARTGAANVSVWRTILTLRKTDLRFTLLFVGFMLL